MTADLWPDLRTLVPQSDVARLVSKIRRLPNGCWEFQDENIVVRGTGITALNAKKRKCPQGHPYDYRAPDGKRRCRECMKEHSRNWKRKQRALGRL